MTRLKPVIRHARAWGANRVLVEKASSGLSLLQDLMGKVDINLIPVIPHGDKLVRAEHCSADVEAKRVYLPDEAEWLAEFEAEVFAFPESKYADQVDSMSQFLTAWKRGKARQLEARVTYVGERTGTRSTYYDRMGGAFPF